MKSRLKQRIFALSLLAWTAVCPADAQQTRSLRDQFLSPSDEAKPWTFWYWMYGAVSKEGITADLDSMISAVLSVLNCFRLFIHFYGRCCSLFLVLLRTIRMQ